MNPHGTPLVQYLNKFRPNEAGTSKTTFPSHFTKAAELMDATDDREIKLQRKANDLLSDLDRSLKRCLWSRDSNRSAQLQRAVKIRDLDRLSGLLEHFQEWPQLLDPQLSSLLPPLMSALSELACSAGIQTASAPISLSSTQVSSRFAICKLLYTFCKIRGAKVITRFFSNEARLLETVLRAYRRWDPSPSANAEQNHHSACGLAWEERYVVFLWLSHLLLAPFDISLMSGVEGFDGIVDLPADLDLPKDLPWTAQCLVSLGLQYLGAASRVRNAAESLLLRLSVRGDMIRAGLMRCLVMWILSRFEDTQQLGLMTVYCRAGCLSFLAHLFQTVGHEDVAFFLPRLFPAVQSVASSDDPVYRDARSSALVRKAVVKLYRNIASVALLTPDDDPSAGIVSSSVSLDDVVDYLLTALADSDTPVRYAASKAISVITGKLGQDLARDIVDALISSYSENLGSDASFWDVEKVLAGADPFQPDANALSFATVNALRWHGLTLTLSNLLLHRSPPADQLPKIVYFLLLALRFEQRSATGSALGANVRDAACFGVWSLSRKYSTTELQTIEAGNIPATLQRQGVYSVVQTLATELVVTACLDPVGNIRRGSSAALQELIGRHPDTIIAGIPLVQIVDYHAVALRSKALTSVGIDAAKLDVVYWDALFGGMRGWRGIFSPDAQPRRIAAQGIGTLGFIGAEQFAHVEQVCDTILDTIAGVQPRQVEQRHGTLLALSALLDNLYYNYTSQGKEGASSSSSKLLARVIVGKTTTALERLTTEQLTLPSLRPELTAEAAFRLVASTALILGCLLAEPESARPPPIYSLVQRFTLKAVEILQSSVLRSSNEFLDAYTAAARALFALLAPKERLELARSWVSQLQGEAMGSSSGTGRRIAYLHVLGAVCRYFLPAHEVRSTALEGGEIVKTLVSHTAAPATLETRVAALQSIIGGFLSIPGWRQVEGPTHTGETPGHLVLEAIASCLDDYTIDSRGDIGSLVRIEAIDAVTATVVSLSKQSPDEQAHITKILLPGVARLSAEKLDKVRLRSFKCLHQALQASHPELLGTLIEDVDQASSSAYFRRLLHISLLKDLAWLHLPIIEGFVTSAGAGSESVLQAARRALADVVEHPPAEAGPSSAVARKLFTSLITILANKWRTDRIAVPALEVLAFALQFGLILAEPLEDSLLSTALAAVQKCHYKTRSMQRLEAAVKAYSGLALLPAPVRKDALLKLTSMLLHPFPRVRVLVAEALYAHFSADFFLPAHKARYTEEDGFQRAACTMAKANWSLPAAMLKDDVSVVRRCIEHRLELAA